MYIISPITRQKMGKTLIAAIQAKNTIETLIDNGIIVGELAIDWKKRSHENDHIKDFVQKAERGDTAMMLKIGSWYESDSNGFPRDTVKAHAWYLKAHYAGDARGTYRVGLFFLNGYVVTKNTGKGMIYMAEAATKGSWHAAKELEESYGQGKNGLSVDPEEARRWHDHALALFLNRTS